MDGLTIRFEGRKFKVGQQTVVLADGSTASRDVVLHRGSVVILPCVNAQELCLIRVHRWSVKETLYELPAGTLEEGEDPAETARRELVEETGYRAQRFAKLLEFYTSPGFLTERMHLYLADELTPGPSQPEPDERITPQVVTWEEAMRLVAQGEIRDGKTLVGLLYYQAMKAGLVAAPEALKR